MTSRVFLLVVMATVVLAGCTGGPTDASPGETSSTPSVTADDVPGVTNESLTNATALAEANEAALSETGGEIQLLQSEGGEAIEYRMRVSPGFSTHSLSGTYPDADGQTAEVDLWANETTQFVHTTSPDDERYRVAPREDQVPNSLTLVESFVAGGQFTVQNESTGDGTVVLTADEYVSPDDGQSAFRQVSSFDGTLVVDGTGQIHNLTVSAVDDGRSVTYRYELVETGIGELSKPGWLEDVPESASIQANIEVTVENSSYLAIEHRGGDVVPPSSTLRLTTNGTTTTATISSSLEAGDRLYAHLHTSDGTLRVSEERPDSDVVKPVTSPVSVSLATADGRTLVNAGMGWSSESASAGEGSSGEASQDSSKLHHMVRLVP